MSKTKIKICGLTRMQDIEYVNEALPDYIGFVFAASSRHISMEAAAQLKNALDSKIKSIGVFVNEDLKVITDICTRGIIDYVQLHGNEDDEYIQALHHKVSIPIIKAIRVKDVNSLKGTEQLSCDFLLLDTYSEKEFGGTGKAFDWKFTNNATKPFFLAGGINLGNANAAIEKTQPYCLDVSSGVETNGLKDRNKIIQLVNLVKR